MTELKKDRLLLIASWVKGVTGTIGMSALITDHKWIGITVLILGAMANEYIRVVTKSHV
jgi:hypothetical protein